MYDRLGDAIGGLAGTAETLSGELGYSLNGTFRVVDPDDPRKFLVRYANGNFVSAFHYNRVLQKPGKPVLTSIDSLGQTYIVGEDKTKSVSFTPPGSGGQAVGWHIHPRGSGMEFITDTWMLKQLRVAPVTGTMAVTVAAGSYDFNRSIKWFSGDTLDLNPYRPTGAGSSVWVIVALNPITGTALVLSGDSFISDPPADPVRLPLIACTQLGYIALCAVWIDNADTSLPGYRFEDLRYSVGASPWYLQDLYNVNGGYEYNDYVLTFYDGYWSAKRSTGSGSTTLAGLTDVDVAGAGIGDVLTVKTISPSLTFDLETPTGGSGGVTVGVYADARPSSPSSGDIFIPTDGYWWEVFHNSIWNPYIENQLLVTPPSASWSWDNQGGATIDSSLGALYLRVPAGATALAMRLRYRTAPATPYTITTRIEPNLITGAQPYFSIGFRENSSGKLHAFLVSPDVSGGKPQIFSSKFTNSTTYLTNYAGTAIPVPHVPYWFQISDDGTNRILRYSNDGKHYVTLHTITRTDFLTADQVYFGCAPVDLTFDSDLTVLSWAQT